MGVEHSSRPAPWAGMLASGLSCVFELFGRDVAAAGGHGNGGWEVVADEVLRC